MKQKIINFTKFRYRLIGMGWVRGQGMWVDGANLSCHWERGGEYSGQVNQSSTLTLISMSNSTINQACMYWGSGRKSEYLEKTHTYTGRTCISTRKVLSRESNQEPSYCETPVLFPKDSPHASEVNPTCIGKHNLVRLSPLLDTVWFYLFYFFVMPVHCMTCEYSYF